jgi:hypothetical protein
MLLLPAESIAAYHIVLHACLHACSDCHHRQSQQLSDIRDEDKTLFEAFILHKNPLSWAGT